MLTYMILSASFEELIKLQLYRLYWSSEIAVFVSALVFTSFEMYVRLGFPVDLYFILKFIYLFLVHWMLLDITRVSLILGISTHIMHNVLDECLVIAGIRFPLDYTSVVIIYTIITFLYHNNNKNGKTKMECST